MQPGSINSKESGYLKPLANSIRKIALKTSMFLEKGEVKSKGGICITQIAAPYLLLGLIRGVQPAACGPHATQDGYECGPTQNHKFT